LRSHLPTGFDRTHIHEGLDSTLMILQSRLSETSTQRGIKVVKDYGDLPRVECYTSQMNQVFMNILSNAIDALGEKRVRGQGSGVSDREQEDEFVPCITICTKMQKIDPQLNRHQPFSVMPQLSIRIADNGCGMSKSVLSRVFDPFFTTKPIGSGTGLGLTTSYQIVVECHKDTIQVSSVEGQGTEFVIELPLQQNQRI
jgi:signal transduction histidine kinase